MGLIPSFVGLAGFLYGAAALAVGVHYLVAAWRFRAHVSDGSARRLLWSSFLYLPVILLLLLWNPLARF